FFGKRPRMFDDREGGVPQAPKKARKKALRKSELYSLVRAGCVSLNVLITTGALFGSTCV
ncbi:MAG: hypothetical protein RBT35_08655, partial [Bacteroidales bacterium]|nr:hypothetical protein [Bacteroidales bacterium]